MKVLIACEYSGVVREAFKALGHDAWSCDLLDTEIPGQHYKCDVRDLLNKFFDLVIFHPVCTRLANSGVRWLHERNLWNELEKAIEFFNLRHKFNSDRVATENPIPHKYAIDGIGKYDQIIQPYEFGHLGRKATCLWLKGLPKLKPTNNVKAEMDKLPKNQSQRIHYTPPGPDRWKIRSRTFTGIAEAMAQQWG